MTQAILIVVDSFGLIVGGLAAAALLCWSLWVTCRLVRRPEWSALGIAALAALALFGGLPRSEFLDLTIAFASIAAAPLWNAGKRPHFRITPASGPGAATALHGGSPPRAAPASVVPAVRRYPALTACIGEQRPPTRDETRLLASRLWREGLALRSGAPPASAGFAARRKLMRAVAAALGGDDVEVPSDGRRRLSRPQDQAARQSPSAGPTWDRP